MNSIQLPAAIRTTAAALAVFMTVATLNSLIMVAEPQQSPFIAQHTARDGAAIAAASEPLRVVIVLQAPDRELEH
jgi:hypothetical protein